MELHLVADTNLFFEFKALEQLPWSELGADPIVIILTKPVLDEIDKHKKSGGRTRERAIEVFNRFRAMLETRKPEVVIQASSPRVVLRRTVSALPAPRLNENLDYGRNDERLIGIAAGLSDQASGYEVKLFTDDGGPAGMADDLGVPLKMIDPAWRRPPAESMEAKRLKEVEKDLALYRSQEPKISIRCDQAGHDKSVRVIRKVAASLSEAEIDSLVEALVLKHPEATEFAAPEDTVVTEPNGDVVTTVFAAPAKEEIVSYRSVHRPAWIESCRNVLRGLHVGRDEMESPIELRWTMVNEGTRPAEMVRIEFAAQGPLRILREREDADADDAEIRSNVEITSQPQASRLPAPPKPPAFTQTVTRLPGPAKPKTGNGVELTSLRALAPSDAQRKIAAQAMKNYDLLKIGQVPGHLGATRISAATRALQDATFGGLRLDGLFRPEALGIATTRFDPLPIHRYIPKPHDSEAFYFSSWPDGTPVEKGALTCDSWRHRDEEEIFEFEILLQNDGEVRGVVECTVHAHNLTKPTQAKVFVERKFEPLSMLDLAQSLIDACA